MKPQAKIISLAQLPSADLVVDAVYQGGRSGNFSDDPYPKLLSVSNQGGFRYRGDIKGRLDMLLLSTSLNDVDWPDSIDRETGVFTYYGDNKKPGLDLHATGRFGNQILQRIFEDAHGNEDSRRRVPPIFVFARTGAYRDATFLGLAVPGASDLTLAEDLVGIWRIAGNSRFQNYRSRFTILDVPVVQRAWLDSIIAGAADEALAPAAWETWRRTGRRKALIATRSLEYRRPVEQQPSDAEGEQIIQVVRTYFAKRPHAFEHCAAALARLMIPSIAAVDVTRPSRDYGRDAIGQLRIGSGPGSILVDFALEAKCYSPPSGVNVKDMSRLISRLRHRQFGVLVTTTWVQHQAYQEIKEDQHPIVVIAASDIVALLKAAGHGSPAATLHWLKSEFPLEELPGTAPLSTWE